MEKQNSSYYEGKSNDRLVEEMMWEQQHGEDFQRVETTNVKIAEIYG